MTQNMASLDRAIRVLIAVGVAVLYLTEQISGAAALALGTLSVVFLLTSFMGFCPIYAACKVSSKRTEKSA